MRGHNVDYHQFLLIMYAELIEIQCLPDTLTGFSMPQSVQIALYYLVSFGYYCMFDFVPAHSISTVDRCRIIAE